MCKLRYIVINRIPRLAEEISIPERGMEGISLNEVYHSIWRKDGEPITTESREILDKERNTLSEYPDMFRHKYYEYKGHFKSIDDLIYNAMIIPDVTVLSFKDRQDKVDNQISNYLSNNNLTYEELLDNSAFRFEYWVSRNSQRFSKWYPTEAEAFNKLLSLINVLNTGTNPGANIVLEL